MKRVIVKQTQKTEKEMLDEAYTILDGFKQRGTHPVDALIVLEMIADSIREQVIKSMQNEEQKQPKGPVN